MYLREGGPVVGLDRYQAATTDKEVVPCKYLFVISAAIPYIAGNYVQCVHS